MRSIVLQISWPGVMSLKTIGWAELLALLTPHMRSIVLKISWPRAMSHKISWSTSNFDFTHAQYSSENQLTWSDVVQVEWDSSVWAVLRLAPLPNLYKGELFSFILFNNLLYMLLQLLTQLVEVLILKLELHDLLVDDHLHVLVVRVAIGLPAADLL
jgi:hypothetical protein